MAGRLVDLLCLANSRKQGGHCIAGLDIETGEWVRPVSSTLHGELSAGDCTLDNGQLPALLDVVRIPIGDQAPEPHQPENSLIATGGWTYVGSMALDDARQYLDPICSPGPEIFGDRSDRIDWDEIQADPLAASLTVVKVDAPTFAFNPWNSFRARFQLARWWYDLGFTDLSPWASEAKKNAPIATTSEWYLTISLGEPYDRDNQCYKLAAAAIEAG